MPANRRSTGSSSKASKKAAKKATKEVTKKAAKKTTNKVAKKTAKKATKKVGKKATKKVGKKVTKKTARRAQGSRKKIGGVSAAARSEMIEKAAYLRAEKRNFQNGDPVADWLSCEKEIDALLSKDAR